MQVQHSLSRLLSSPLGFLVVCAPSMAQGSDQCATAQPIAGEGLFAFDNTSATTDGVGTGCDANPTRDVWFLWTAPTSEFATVRTCGFSSLDTMLAAYTPGNCPPTAVLACADDSCGLQSSIAFSATAGTDYLLRFGVYPGSNPGTGMLEIVMGEAGCADPSEGPDVIVGDLYDIDKWGSSGGVTSYSLGTYSCNIGDQNLRWFANTNQHPVIAQNIYRLENGRLEQLGLSWLKHGFTALTDELCCDDCIEPGSGSLLGVGCADPYSASLNGSQPGLGPRFEVNPWTGVFAYPFTGQGQSGNVLYKRIQIPNSEIDPALHPGADFFCEGQYVTPDDASAGNQMNNASWRDLNVGSFSGGGWVLNLAGSTNRTEPAIMAWQAADPGVRIEHVQAAGDGRFYVGSDATDNGDGTWHYEFAIFNLNSERAGQKFSVPIGPGVTVSNVGFHDVNYHSGEPFDGTDWTPTVFADRVEWQTETFAVDPDANALRWGTLYNFRFDASAAPEDDVATLTFFKPGSPASEDVLISAPGGDCSVTSYCLTSPNSVGSGALMSSTGSTSIAANDLTLFAGGAPAGQFSLFYYGPNQSQVVFGNGFRCVGGSLTRLPVQMIDVFGMGTQPIDYPNLPPNGQINAGETHNFQFWYRDPQGGGAFFNLSDALSITFCP